MSEVALIPGITSSIAHYPDMYNCNVTGIQIGLQRTESVLK